jgi:glycosyltransferase involved in cell wall biosynthesis
MEEHPDGPIKFSIIMSAWEDWADLRNAMACVRLQQYQNWELIVVCDGQPTTEAAKIYHKVRKRMGHHRVEIVIADRVEGIWGNRARSIGLDYCTGDYVCWVNHDNVIFPTYLQRHFDNIAGAKEGGEFGPISVLNIDTWVITSRGSHRYCGVFPEETPRLGGFDLMCMAIPLDLARKVDAFGGSMERIHHADWLIYEAASKATGEVRVPLDCPVDGIHF